MKLNLIDNDSMDNDASLELHVTKSGKLYMVLATELTETGVNIPKRQINRIRAWLDLAFPETRPVKPVKARKASKAKRKAA